MKALVLLFTTLLFNQTFGARDVPNRLKKDWKEKSVFFGVNKAWDYLKQEHTTLTYLARDEEFHYQTFDEEKYWKGLIDARQLGLKFAGISNWKIEKKSIERMGPKKILIKVEGTYEARRGAVHFIEWQLFTGEEYHQVALLEDKESYHPVPKQEVPALMKSILKLTTTQENK